MKIIRFIITFIICALFLNIQVYAHPGRTDSDGGHHDNINGGYHYHHGCPEHDHSDGKCHYSERSNSSSPSEDTEEDEQFIRCIGYVFLTFTVLGILNRFRIEIKEKRKGEKLSYIKNKQKEKKRKR